MHIRTVVSSQNIPSERIYSEVIIYTNDYLLQGSNHHNKIAVKCACIGWKWNVADQHNGWNKVDEMNHDFFLLGLRRHKKEHDDKHAFIPKYVKP
jgi:hypothetical protein